MTDSPRRDGPEPPAAATPDTSIRRMRARRPTAPPIRVPPRPGPTEQLPAYSPYGYDPSATGQYGPQYPPGEPPQPPEGPKVAALAVGAGGDRGVTGHRPGHRAGHREQLAGSRPSSRRCRRCRAEHDEPTPHDDACSDHPRLPVADATEPPDHDRPHSEPRDTGCDRNVHLQRLRRRPGHQHHLHRHGGVLQTEFNVMLPWSKTVQLAQPAKDSASVSIINVGREVTCSITVSGVQVQQRSGCGLTICSGLRLSIDGRAPWHAHAQASPSKPAANTEAVRRCPRESHRRCDERREHATARGSDSRAPVIV